MMFDESPSGSDCGGDDGENDFVGFAVCAYRFSAKAAHKAQEYPRNLRRRYLAEVRKIIETSGPDMIRDGASPDEAEFYRVAANVILDRCLDANRDRQGRDVSFDGIAVGHYDPRGPAP